MIWDKIVYIIFGSLLSAFWAALAYYQYTQGHLYWSVFTLFVFVIHALGVNARLTRWYGKL